MAPDVVFNPTETMAFGPLVNYKYRGQSNEDILARMNTGYETFGQQEAQRAPQGGALQQMAPGMASGDVLRALLGYEPV